MQHSKRVSISAFRTGCAVLVFTIIAMPQNLFASEVSSSDAKLVPVSLTLPDEANHMPMDYGYVVPLASPEEVAEAERVFDKWIAAYRAKDYKEQWNLTHPRIRFLLDKEDWKAFMIQSQRKGVVLKSLTKGPMEAISAEKLPCTETGYCYRKDMQVVAIILTTKYKNPDEPMKEYAVMTNSSEGWRWGGGTILNSPMGETAVILDQADEQVMRARAETRAENRIAR